MPLARVTKGNITAEWAYLMPLARVAKGKTEEKHIQAQR